jgi:hypothetical protein
MVICFDARTKQRAIRETRQMLKHYDSQHAVVTSGAEGQKYHVNVARFLTSYGFVVIVRRISMREREFTYIFLLSNL